MKRALKTHLNKTALLPLIPALLLLIYWSVFYSVKYECEAHIVPKTNTPPEQTSVAGLPQSLSKRPVDAEMIELYIRSPNILARLDAKLNLRENFSAPSINRFQRLAPDAPIEDFIKYYRKMVRVTLDNESSILSLGVQGYTAEQAAQLTDAIIEECELFANTISRQVAAKQVDFIKSELSLAEGDLREQTRKLLKYQTSHPDFNPTESSNVIQGIIGKLERELAEASAAFSEKSSYYSTSSAQVAILKAKIDSIQKEISLQRERLSGGTTANLALADSLFEYNHLLIESDFALRKYGAVLTALQAAQASAAMDIQSLVQVSKSQHIENPSYPRLGYWTLSALALGFLLYALAFLVYDSVIWHIDR